MELIEDVVHTASMIHNRLMQYDNHDDWDLTGGKDGGAVDYEAVDTADGLYAESARLGAVNTATLTNAIIAEGRTIHVNYTRAEYRRTHTGVLSFDDGNLPDNLPDTEETTADDKFKFDRRRQNLIRHYHHMKQFARGREKATQEVEVN